MTKILHIITDKNIGGAGHQVLALIKASDSAAFEMEIVVPQDSQLIPQLTAHGITYHEAPDIADKSFSFAGIRALYKLIKQLKPDIVHTHGSMAGRIAARLYRRVRVVHTRHSVFPLASWRKHFPIKQFSGLINNGLSDMAIAVSPAAKDNLLEMGMSDKKIRTVFNGAPPAKDFTTDEIEVLMQKYNIVPGTFVLAIIARLAEVKGHDDVLDAAKAIQDTEIAVSDVACVISDGANTVPDTELDATKVAPDILILVAGNDGDGSNKRLNHLEKRIANENIANVKLLGFIEDVDEIINLSDVLLNASYGTEASSMALIQGMSAGKPAVATVYGGNPYIVQDGVSGLLTPIRDPKAMAEAILRLKSDPALYRQLSDRARQVYRERFTDKKMASDTEAVYNEIFNS